MLVFSGAANYPFPNMTLEIKNYTFQTEDEATTESQPSFNFLIPIRVDRGPVNTFKLFRPGSKNLAIKTFGKPNPQKDGFGMDFVCGILDKLNSSADVGVYVINLRGNDATAPTAIVNMKWKI